MVQPFIMCYALKSSRTQTQKKKVGIYEITRIQNINRNSLTVESNQKGLQLIEMVVSCEVSLVKGRR